MVTNGLWVTNGRQMGDKWEHKYKTDEPNNKKYHNTQISK